MANLRNPNDYAGYLDPGEMYGYPEDGSWGTPEGPRQPVTPIGPPTAEPKQDLSGGGYHQGKQVGGFDQNAALEAAQGAYGGNWDADAMGDFQQRYNSGMGFDELVSAAGEDAKRRFPGTQGGGGGGQTQQMGMPNIQMGQKSNPVMDSLSKLFSTGGYNQDLVNRRVESANESLQRQRKSRDATNRAALASRGILGEGRGHESGAELTALSKLDQSIADQYSGAVRDIYADESGNADARMMQALQTAAGLSAQEAQMVIDRFRAETERTSVGNQFELGKGNLALGNMRGVNDYNLGLGQLGLERDRTLAQLDDADWDRLIEILKSGVDLNTLAGMGYQ